MAGRARVDARATAAAREHVSICATCKAIATDLIRDAAAVHGADPAHRVVATSSSRVGVVSGSTLANRYQLVDNFSYTRGSHDLKFGADISLIRADSFFPRNRDGNFTFTTDAPFDPANLSTYPTQYVVAILNPNQDLPNDLFSFFAQDQWRYKTNLTFNLGVRYDRERGFHKITGVPDDGNNFQPRLGVVMGCGGGLMRGTTLLGWSISRLQRASISSASRPR